MLTLVLDGLVLLTAIAGPVLVRDRTTGSTPPTEPARRLGPAPVWLGAVTIAIFVNQVLFTTYVIRRHQGDATFIARYLPDGWFDTATGNPAMRALAGAIPDPGLLSVTVLRVQAFLELPFVLLAYLTVAGWLGLDLRRPRVIWAASVAYTVVFGAIELSLPNPYTHGDLVMRGASALLTPILLTRLSPPGGGRDDLLRFALSAAALATLVLVMYDTALLYNLGRVGRDLPAAAVAAACSRCRAGTPGTTGTHPARSAGRRPPPWPRGSPGSSSRPWRSGTRSGSAHAGWPSRPPWRSRPGRRSSPYEALIGPVP